MTADAIAKLAKVLGCDLAEGADGPVLMAARVGFSATAGGEFRIDLRDADGRTFAVGLMLPQEAARAAHGMVDVLKHIYAEPGGKHEVH